VGGDVGLVGRQVATGFACAVVLAGGSGTSDWLRVDETAENPRLAPACAPVSASLVGERGWAAATLTTSAAVQPTAKMAAPVSNTDRWLTALLWQKKLM
jgi:hypothetical protein